MKASNLNILEAEVSVVSNSKSPNYQILNHEKYENRNLKVNLNSLRFFEFDKNEKLSSVLYEDPETKSPSNEFRMNLIYYYVFIEIYLLSLLGFSLLLYNSNNMSVVHLEIHLICQLSLGVFSLLILIAIFKSKSFLIRNRNWFLALNCCINFYLILADERVLYKLTGEEYHENRLPLSLGVICIMVMTRVILFDYYLYVIILGMTSIIMFLTAQLSLSPYSNYSILAEAFIIALFIFIQISECYRADMRIKQIF